MSYRRAVNNHVWPYGGDGRPRSQRNEDALRVSQSALSKHMHDLRELGSWIRGSNHPAPEESAILALADPKRKPAAASPRINRFEAFGLMHEALKEKITTAACIELSKKHKYNRIFLPFMVFDDLDKALFRSTLQGNVYLRWSANDSLSSCSRSGLRGRPRITIELSSRLTRRDCSRADILGTLLHQMIHAYLLQVCGHRNAGVDINGHDLRHEHEFLAVQHTIREYFLPGELSTVHCLFGSEERLTSSRTAQRALHSDTYSNRRAHLAPARKVTAGCSSCYGRRRNITATNAEIWRMTALNNIATKKASQSSSETRSQPRQSEHNPLQYVREWVYALPSSVLTEDSNSNKKYCIITDCGLEPKFKSLPSTTDAHGTFVELEYNNLILLASNESNRQVEVFQKAHGMRYRFQPHLREDFKILGAYLTFGDFAPTKRATLQALTEQSPHFFQIAAARSELPIIMDQYRSDIPFIKATIRAVKLSYSMGYEPLAGLAQRRLYSIPYMAEDPVAVLYEIYMMGPMNSDLRKWATSWLSAQLHSSLGSYAAKYPSNLDVLKGSDKWQQSFRNLFLNSPELTQDVAALENSHAYLRSWGVSSPTSTLPNPFAPQANHPDFQAPILYSMNTWPKEIRESSPFPINRPRDWNETERSPSTWPAWGPQDGSPNHRAALPAYLPDLNQRLLDLRINGFP